MTVKCHLIKLKPGSLDRVREWASEINARREEALQTLSDEGVTIESVFFMQNSDGDFLVYYMRAKDFEHAKQVVEKSVHSIDAYHQKFKKDTWESGKPLETLIDLNLNELSS